MVVSRARKQLTLSLTYSLLEDCFVDFELNLEDQCFDFVACPAVPPAGT